MIYNESGEMCLLYENNLVLLEDIRTDISNKKKEIDDLVEELLLNSKELKNVKELDIKSLNKIKRNLKICDIGFKIVGGIAFVSGIGLLILPFIKFSISKFIPGLITFATFLLSFIGTCKISIKDNKLQSELSEKMSNIFNKAVDLLTKIKNKNIDVSLSKECMEQIEKIEKLKKELKESDTTENLDKEDIASLDKDMQKYVIKYDLMKKLRSYIARKRDDDDDIDLKYFRDIEDYGYMIGVVLSTKNKNDMIEVNCIMYGCDHGPYVGEYYKQNYTFENSSGKTFDIIMDGRSAYSYKGKKYIDIEDGFGDGDGEYKFNFDIKNKDIKFKEGTIFYYKFGF